MEAGTATRVRELRRIVSVAAASKLCPDIIAAVPISTNVIRTKRRGPFMRKRTIRCVAIALTFIASAAATAGNPAPEQVPAGPSPEVMKLVEQGSREYLQHHFTQSIGPYSKALTREETLDT